MIEINLLPKELQKKRIELPEVSFLPLIAIFIGVIIVIHLFLALSVNLKARSLKRLERRWQKILPDKENADRLRYELMATRTKIDAIDSLMERRMSWAKKLSDLSDAMIPGIWLNKLWLEKKVVLQTPEIKTGQEGGTQAGAEPKRTVVKTLHLNGGVMAAGGEETATIGKFIKSLKNHQGFFADFSEIESVSIQRAQLKDVEVMDFELICYFK